MTLRIEGTVTDGMGRGREFVALDGYAEQFRRRLGYEPYPGTLNLSLTESLNGRLDALSPVRIEEWERDGKSFGAVDCYPATIRPSETRADEGASAPVHLVVPHRTDHDTETAELISPVRLREAFELGDGESVELRVASREE